MSENTKRAVRADTAVFSAWCAERSLTPLPADPETVAAFIEDAGIVGIPAMDKANPGQFIQDGPKVRRSAATLNRYVASLARIHRAADLLDPTKTERVKLALKGARRTIGTRQRQAAPLNANVLDKLGMVLSGSLRDLRDIALLRTARDLLARRSELVAIDVEDIEAAEDGSGTVLIKRSKTDQTGQGSTQYLAAPTMEALSAYLSAADITEGPVFRRHYQGESVGDRLDAGSVADIFKRLGGLVGLKAADISGHSARVGMCQDLTAAGADLPALMQAGRWKSAAMPARYGERQAAARGAVAKFYNQA
jgi:site-specific recombinase XerD